MTPFRIIVNSLQSPEIIDLHTETEKRIVELLTKVLPHHHLLDLPCFRAYASFEPADVSSDYFEQEGLETTWSPKPDHLDTIGSSGVGWMLWREMARYRVSSIRRVSYPSESDALVRKDTVWPCVSLAMSFATPGHE
ncbi:hypothetical protein TNCV_903401 [Trichonephila clavipes]|nr:hypothetical protein TNCV_903401 [Trichonephila clavipes]